MKKVYVITTDDGLGSHSGHVSNFLIPTSWPEEGIGLSYLQVEFGHSVLDVFRIAAKTAILVSFEAHRMADQCHRTSNHQHWVSAQISSI